MVTKQNSRPFWRESWVSSIGVFILSQLIFITLEATGWMPNYRDMDGKLLGNIMEAAFFKEWFTYYETPHLNLLTLFFGIAFLIPGIIGAIRYVIRKQKD
ncbi:hypothetical protein H8S33_16320 [Ornithinibacillus sp. BX22]|uniref:YfzA-like protein n=2 Tax=Ornithinibacillus TaxID=484508 RepID=A0A923RJX5_9BACI|nr:MULTISPECIES: YfzA family protein [Ornithinibacillus]MBC5638346.1 hypothetical protein [Ornithinibacillus hominis]MBS3678679.1 hypothetical protein [Ornithinibacillus massiliensis]